MAQYSLAGPAGIVQPSDNVALQSGNIPCSGNVATSKPAPTRMWARVFTGDAPADPSDVPPNPWYDGDPNNLTKENTSPGANWSFSSPLSAPSGSIAAGSRHHVVVWSVFPDEPSVIVPDAKNFRLGIALVPDSVQASFTLRGTGICDIFHATLTRTPNTAIWSGTANSSCIQPASFSVQMTCSVNSATGQLQVQIQVQNGFPAFANDVNPVIGSAGAFSASWTSTGINTGTLNLMNCGCVGAPGLFAFVQ